MIFTSYGLNSNTGNNHLNINKNKDLNKNQKTRIKKTFATKTAINLLNLNNTKNNSLSNSELINIQNNYINKKKINKIRTLKTTYNHKFLTNKTQKLKNQIIHKKKTISKNIKYLHTTFDNIININTKTSS